MKIEEIDKNLKVETDITEPDIIWLDAKDAPFSLHGISYDKNQGCYVRLDQSIADQVSPGVSNLNRQTSGGRVRFRTNSTYIAIRAVMKNRVPMSHMTLAGQSGFDIYRKNDAGFEIYYRTFVPPMGMKEGYSSPIRCPGNDTEYTINFPLYDAVCELYIALKKDATLSAPEPYKISTPVVYYGSSITQGGCASRPGNCYQGILSRRLNMDFIDLGFSGSGRGETPIADYIASLNMSAFICDYDYNSPDCEHLETTHMAMYRTVREKHPQLPILFISAPDILLNPANFIPRREIIRKTYETARAEGDMKVWFLPGEKLFEGEGWDGCTVDGVHPNDLGFYRMATAIEPYLKEMLNLN